MVLSKFLFLLAYFLGLWSSQLGLVMAPGALGCMLWRLLVGNIRGEQQGSWPFGEDPQLTFPLSANTGNFVLFLVQQEARIPE